MFSRQKSIPIKIAQYLKLPQTNAMNYQSSLRTFKSIISGHQIAYNIVSYQKTVFFYKKNNLTMFHNIKNVAEKESERVVILPLSNKNDFKAYYKSSNNIIESNFRGKYFRFLDINNELYEVIIRYQYDSTVLTILNFTSGEFIFSKKVKGRIMSSIPIYNNYVPIATIINNQLEVYLFDVYNRKISKIAKYSMSFLEKELYKFLITVCDSTRKEIKELIMHGRGSYRLDKSYDVCQDFLICKSFIHITNDNLTGDNNANVFVIAFTGDNNVINCKLFVPADASFKPLELDKVYIEHIIDIKQIQIVLPDGNYIMPNILYHDEKYALAYDIVNTESYFIVPRDASSKHFTNSASDDMFKAYVTDDFIAMVYERSHEKYWLKYFDILVYDTKHNIWSRKTLIGDASADLGVYGCYYIKKCRKVVFLMYRLGGSTSSFYNMDEHRRAFRIEQAIVVELSSDVDNVNSENLRLNLIIGQYITNKYGSKCQDFRVKSTDCSIDVNNGIMYITGSIINCEISVLTLECDLCNKYMIRELEIQYPVVRSQDVALDKKIPIYLSTKSLKRKGFPKYLPMYISNEFYDFIINKASYSDLIFSSHSQLNVRDRYYNRIDAVLNDVQILEKSVSIGVKDDVVAMHYIHDGSLIAVMVIHDLAIVRTAHR
jgi:hypothetical protein